MIHEVLPVGMLECNCSIFGDESTREAIVIDPGDNVDDILEVLTQHSLKVATIVITHGHIDHIGGANTLRAYTGAPVHMNSNDLSLLDHLDTQSSWLGMAPVGQIEIDSGANDGDIISVGSIALTVLHTPGHSQGSISLWIPSEKKLISGDTLFRDSIGRTDLPGGDSKQILKSIKDKLLPLPDDVVIFPGHGPSTTMGREKESNFFLQRL